MTETSNAAAPAAHFYRDARPDRHQLRRADTVLSLSAGLTGRALDYGAGWGDLTARLAGQFDAMEGVDVEVDRVAFATMQYAPIVFRPCAAEGLDYPNASFDVVYSTVVLHFVPSPEGHLSECLRVLRPDGRLVVMIQNPESMYMVARRWRKDVNDRQRWGGKTLREFTAWLEQHGLEIEARAGFYDPPFDKLANLGDYLLGAMNGIGHLFSIPNHWSYVGFRCRKVV